MKIFKNIFFLLILFLNSFTCFSFEIGELERQFYDIKIDRYKFNDSNELTFLVAVFDKSKDVKKLIKFSDFLKEKNNLKEYILEKDAIKPNKLYTTYFFRRFMGKVPYFNEFFVLEVVGNRYIEFILNNHTIIKPFNKYKAPNNYSLEFFKDIIFEEKMKFEDKGKINIVDVELVIFNQSLMRTENYKFIKDINDKSNYYCYSIDFIYADLERKKYYTFIFNAETFEKFCEIQFHENSISYDKEILKMIYFEKVEKLKKINL